MKKTLKFSHTHNYSWWLWIVVSFLVRGLRINGETCGNGIKTPGWTVPAGDIVLREGETLNITCLLDPEIAALNNYSSHQIIFTQSNQVLSPTLVTVLNDTAARLIIRNMTATNEWFYCKLALDPATNNSLEDGSSLEVPNSPSNGLAVCPNIVAVGGLPKEVKNITCVSYDWKVLNCSWVVPENEVKTTYSVFYSPPNRGGRNMMYRCPEESHEQVENRCSWTPTSKPAYRRNFEYLMIYVIGKNPFGETKQSPIRFHHYAHIIPSAPKQLQVVEKTTSSFYLKWNIDALVTFEKGWVYNVSYLRTNADGWNSTLYNGKFLQTENDDVFVNVTGLKYPNTVYDIRVRMKSSVAAADQGWSEPVSIVVKTKACPPYRSPRIDVGSFEVANVPVTTATSRIVYVYWQPLVTLEYNGDNFRYEIVIYEDDKEVQIKAIMMRYSYAKYEIDFHSYTFHIYAANSEGRAPNASRVYVPRREEGVETPVIVSKIDYGNGVYEMSWKMADTSGARINNYTAFWCESVKEYPYQCDGYIDWVQVVAHVNKYNFTVNSNKAYQFAVSANSATVGSSGMIWASCTVMHDRVTKIKNVWVDKAGSYYILIKWKLECSERIDALKGYYIYYCVIESPVDSSNCSGSMKNLTIYGDLDTDQVNITDLEPFKNYKISIAMFSSNSTGLHSDPLIVKTLDGKPDVSNIQVETTAITNTSITLRWPAPKATNGMLKYYIVNYNNGVIEKEEVVNKTEVTLTNLTSFELYSIKLQACTIICSEPLMPVAFKTKIGRPGTITGASQNINASHVVITWAKPEMAGGPNPSYRVRIKYRGDQSKADKEFETADNNTIVDLTSCTSGSFTVQIRAENKDDKSANNNTIYPGEWSKEIYNNCSDGSAMPSSLKFVICIVVLIIIATLFVTWAKKVLFKCQQMQKVEVTLPAKFTNAPTITPLFPSETKEREFYGDFNPPSSKSVEQFYNLVEKSTELNVFLVSQDDE